MKPIRFVLGNIILFLDFIFSPTGIKRLDEHQDRVDAETASLCVYELEMCPFCVKVRRAIKRLSLKIELKDVLEPKNQTELMAGGKKDQVPCLRITQADGSVQWMYESSAIIAHLEQHFSSVI
ncbi:MAG: glutathione S-transferase N-terminal domain-containing protein [Bdellovibrionales bacterium]|nr:glutathione S-transferase N-terminal domain-containing protein [Oligoflexia bacterium]